MNHSEPKIKPKDHHQKAQSFGVHGKLKPSGIKRYFIIYKECLKISFATQASYRLNFLLSNLISLISNTLFPLVTLLIYGSGASFPGWSLYEVLLIQSIFTLSTGVNNIIFNGLLWATTDYIVHGSFETVLIKPVNPLFYIIASTIQLDNLGLCLGGIIVFFVSLSYIGPVSFVMGLQFLLFFLSGIFIMMGLSLIMAAASFKWVGNGRLPEIFDSIKNFGKYPQSIFSKTIIGITSFIIPVAMIGYFPASALLGKTDLSMYIAAVPSLLFAAFGIFFYMHMIHLYEGVGG